jgi:hypothetical protein
MACQFQTLIRPSLSVTTRITRKVEDPLYRHPEETFMSAQPAIVFVHGMYMNGVRWDPWVERAKRRPSHLGPLQTRCSSDDHLTTH